MERRTDWNHYVYRYGEGSDAREARVEFDVMAAITGTDGAHTVRVIAPEGASLDDALATLDGLHVGTLHYAGKVERVVACAAPLPEAVRTGLEAAGAAVHVLAGTDYVSDRVHPGPADWRRITDREALERLDLDGDGELRVLHRFYGPASGLQAVAERLEPEGFERVDGDGERLTLAHRHPIGRISEITLGLMRLGEGHGVAYDGWVLPG